MTKYKSLVEIDTDATAKAGWCLDEQQKVFKAPVKYAHATEAYEKGVKFKHETRELPNVPVPVWFTWINHIKGDPNYGVNQGHVVARVPGRGFLSSPGVGVGQKWFKSIVEIEQYFGAKFRGWSQDINGKRVAQPVVVSKPTPKPTTPAPAPVATGFKVGDRVVPKNNQTTDYKGTPVQAWHPAYTITELRGDRAVLSASGKVWAAISTSKIKKV